jgi:putative ABC transport system permease protein
MTYPVRVPWSLLLPLVGALAVPLVLRLGGRVPLAYNLRNLAVRWRTTLLTAAAFTLVVLLLIIMLAFVHGMERLAGASGHPGNVLVLSQGITDELMSYIPFSDVGDLSLQTGVERDDEGRLLCSREVYTVVSQPAEPAGQRPEQQFVQIRGVELPELAARVHGLRLAPGGHWFSPAGVREAADTDPEYGSQPLVEAVLGEGVARERGVTLGDVFPVGPRRWLVVGILESAGSTFASEIWASRQVVGQTFGVENAYTSVVLRTAGAESARHLCQEITARFKRVGLWAVPEADYYVKMAAMDQHYLTASYLIACFLAVGGACSLMHTLFAAIAQRGKEIAVLRVLGYSRRQILASFLLEALLIALAGGLAGCALGCFAHDGTASGTISGDQGMGKAVLLRLTVDARTLTAGLLFTVLMGTLGGLLPALAATRLRPLETLR